MGRRSGLGALLQGKNETKDAFREIGTVCLGEEIPQKSALNYSNDFTARSALRVADLTGKGLANPCREMPLEIESICRD